MRVVHEQSEHAVRHAVSREKWEYAAVWFLPLNCSKVDRLFRLPRRKWNIENKRNLVQEANYGLQAMRFR
jgi:hypothetical protein